MGIEYLLRCKVSKAYSDNSAGFGDPANWRTRTQLKRIAVYRRPVVGWAEWLLTSHQWLQSCAVIYMFMCIHQPVRIVSTGLPENGVSTPCIFDESHCIMQQIRVGVGVTVGIGKGRKGAVSRLTGFISPFYVRFMCRRSQSRLYRSSDDSDIDMGGRRLHVGL